MLVTYKARTNISTSDKHLAELHKWVKCDKMFWNSGPCGPYCRHLMDLTYGAVKISNLVLNATRYCSDYCTFHGMVVSGVHTCNYVLYCSVSIYWQREFEAIGKNPVQIVPVFNLEIVCKFTSTAVNCLPSAPGAYTSKLFTAVIFAVSQKASVCYKCKLRS